MAEEDSTSVNDTSVSDDTNDDDTSLEDIEVDIEDITADEEPDELDDSDEDEATDVADDDSEAEDVEDQDTTDEEDSDAEQSDEQKQASFNKQMFERRQAEKAQREQVIKESQQAYLDESEDPRDLALRQLQVDAYDNRVDKITNTLTNDYSRAINDFEVLKTSDPVIQAEIDDAIDAFQAKFVTIDEFGNATQVNGDLYATLQAKADSITKLTGLGAKKQVQNKAKEKSKTLATPGRSPREPKVDPALAAFDEEAYG